MKANRKCRMDYAPDMCPVSLRILAETVMVGNRYDATAADIRETITTLKSAAKAVL
jgi:hypothetical protein